MLSRIILILILTGTLAQLLGGQAVAQSRNSVSQRGDVWKWERHKNGSTLELTIQGEVEFNENPFEIKSLNPGSSFALKEKRAEVRRQIEIKPSSTGLSISYFVDGRSQSFDAQAKAWVAGVLAEAIRENGLNAGPRAQQILRDRGTSSLLAEVSRFKSDHVKQLYVQELYKSGGLDVSGALRLVGLVAREMSSDYYKAQVLLGLPEQVLRDEAVRRAYQQAIESVRSDYYQAEVLSAYLKAGRLSKESLLSVFNGAGVITSDHYKAQVLQNVTANSLADDALRSAFGAAVATVGSDFYRTEALSGLVRKGALSQEVLVTAAQATSGIASDHYKAEMLLKLVRASADTEGARTSLVEAARTIKSEQERGRVLSAIFK